MDFCRSYKGYSALHMFYFQPSKIFYYVRQVLNQDSTVFYGKWDSLYIGLL